MWCSIVENPNILVFSLSRVAGIYPTNNPSFISKRVLGKSITSGKINDTESTIDVSTKNRKKIMNTLCPKKFKTVYSQIWTPLVFLIFHHFQYQTQDHQHTLWLFRNPQKNSHVQNDYHQNHNQRHQVWRGWRGCQTILSLMLNLVDYG